MHARIHDFTVWGTGPGSRWESKPRQAPAALRQTPRANHGRLRLSCAASLGGQGRGQGEDQSSKPRKLGAVKRAAEYAERKLKDAVKDAAEWAASKACAIAIEPVKGLLIAAKGALLLAAKYACRHACKHACRHAPGGCLALVESHCRNGSKKYQPGYTSTLDIRKFQLRW